MKRPPSRQASAFPVHLAGRKSASAVRSQCFGLVQSSSVGDTEIDNVYPSSEGGSTGGLGVGSVADDAVGTDHVTAALMTTMARPPSRQKIGAQDLWDGVDSRESRRTDNTDYSDDDRNLRHDPRADGFLDLDDTGEHAPFKIEINSSANLEFDDAIEKVHIGTCVETGLVVGSASKLNSHCRKNSYNSSSSSDCDVLGGESAVSSAHRPRTVHIGGTGSVSKSKLQGYNAGHSNHAFFGASGAVIPGHGAQNLVANEITNVYEPQQPQLHYSMSAGAVRKRPGVGVQVASVPSNPGTSSGQCSSPWDSGHSPLNHFEDFSPLGSPVSAKGRKSTTDLQDSRMRQYSKEDSLSRTPSAWISKSTAFISSAKSPLCDGGSGGTGGDRRTSDIHIGSPPVIGLPAGVGGHMKNGFDDNIVRKIDSPVSFGSTGEIYDDDDDSILTEVSGELNTIQSMQTLVLDSSLGEDFLSLFAPPTGI